MKPNLFKRGKFWWCRGIHLGTCRPIVVHGRNYMDAFNRFKIMRSL